jgi:hypothetical protein
MSRIVAVIPDVTMARPNGAILRSYLREDLKCNSLCFICCYSQKERKNRDLALRKEKQRGMEKRNEWKENRRKERKINEGIHRIEKLPNLIKVSIGT